MLSHNFVIKEKQEEEYLHNIFYKFPTKFNCDMGILGQVGSLFHYYGIYIIVTPGVFTIFAATIILFILQIG